MVHNFLCHGHKILHLPRHQTCHVGLPFFKKRTIFAHRDYIQWFNGIAAKFSTIPRTFDLQFFRRFSDLEFFIPIFRATEFSH